MDVKEYFWICPECGEKVDVLKQLVDTCFDEDGEAQFAVEEHCGLWYHTIFCPKCTAEWTIHTSGLITNDYKDNQSDEDKIIIQLIRIIKELDARNYSNNCVVPGLTSKGWIELCEDGIKLFEQLKF